MKNVHREYSKIMGEVTGDMEQCARSEKELSGLERRVKKSERVFVEMFERDCDFDLCILEYYLLDHMVDNIRRFGALSILDSSLYEHFIVHIK